MMAVQRSCGLSSRVLAYAGRSLRRTSKLAPDHFFAQMMFTAFLERHGQVYFFNRVAGNSTRIVRQAPQGLRGDERDSNRKWTT
jgi:hypothetical protein